MEGSPACACGEDRYDPGSIPELALRRCCARRPRSLLRRATLGGRDARRAPVPERRRAARDGGAGLVEAGARGGEHHRHAAARARKTGALRGGTTPHTGDRGGGRPGGAAAVPRAPRWGGGGPGPAPTRSPPTGRVANLPPGDGNPPAGTY